MSSADATPAISKPALLGITRSTLSLADLERVRLVGLLSRLAESARIGEAGRFAPWAQRALGRGGLLGGAFRLMFRPRLEGWENLPGEGAYLIVVNHSGGGGADVAVLASLWAERFGGEHRLAAMAHPLAFHCPGVAALVRGLGAVPSSYGHALRALRAGTPVLVFPGGDHEAWRPVWQAKRVDFNGRQGFLRLAREAQVPIVPLGLRGASYTNPMLWRSRLLAYLLVLPRLLGLKRFPLTLSGAVGAALLIAVIGPQWGPIPATFAAWAWVMSPLTVLGPWIPWTVSGAIGAPINPEELFASVEDLAPAHERVRGAVAALVEGSP